MSSVLTKNYAYTIIGIILIFSSIILPNTALGLPASIVVNVANAPATPTVTQWLCCPDPITAKDQKIRVEWWVSSQVSVDKFDWKIDQSNWFTFDPASSWQTFEADGSGVAGCGHYVWSGAPAYQDFGPNVHIVYVKLYHGSTEYAFQNTFTPTYTGIAYIEGMWVNPTAGQSVSGTISIQVKASKITTMPSQTKFYVDKVLKASMTFTEYPSWGAGYRYGWTTGWDTTTVTNGAHTLKVEYTMPDGNVFTMSILAQTAADIEEEPWLHNPMDAPQRQALLLIGLLLLIAPNIMGLKKKSLS